MLGTRGPEPLTPRSSKTFNSSDRTGSTQLRMFG
jgi:hypothetical protein